MIKIDINFDFRKDSFCEDPDADSLKLYEIHKILWSKNLPNGNVFIFEILLIRGKYGRILLKNNLYDNLSSDRMCPHFIGQCKGKFDSWLTESENEEFKHIVRTIGGHIVFPAHKKNGLTINQARGVNRKICDRFDLTLECIRLYYLDESSPLFDTIFRYDGFFRLFENFENYINFFLLQDFVNENYHVKFTLPFDNFERSALPLNVEEYKLYKTETINQIERRNNRILVMQER
ncbi:hypothetical protein HX065_15060 [Myroides odoratimimus]|uniref:DUF6994 family protein n=1 Tax=Myroides odoratimimus TaxID=76832 RepID=UPI00257904E7|nr:hypothetical protein [Myroides odoratimimus]MDM1461341.1 hypothetical protein [Myroides odoratimimus]